MVPRARQLGTNCPLCPGVEGGREVYIEDRFYYILKHFIEDLSGYPQGIHFKIPFISKFPEFSPDFR